MNQGWAVLFFVIVVLTSATSVAGDYFLKHVSARDYPLMTFGFAIGASFYFASAIGWTYLMRHMSLAGVGIYYTAVTLLLLAALGTLVFREPLGLREVAGIVCALAAVALLAKFA